MKLVVCDASPLVFLAKLDLLRLIYEVLGGDVFVLKCVVDEVCSESALPMERDRLDAFFQNVTVVDSTESRHQSRSLSKCDHYTLTWAVDNDADWLVADERLLRRVAKGEGISVVGFLGLIVEGTRSELLATEEAVEAVDAAVSQHGCRISIALYQQVIKELKSLSN